MLRVSSVAAIATAFALVTVARSSSANPRELPFTYPYGTLGEGEAELEQYADFTPIKVLSGASGAPQYYGATQFQTEFEYGITDHLELGLYVTFVPSAGDAYAQVPAMTEGNGIKQRLRYRFAEEGEWPVDVALYGELVENEREIEIEAKIILAKRFGRLGLMANLWAEREYYFINQRDWVLNPTAGITYQVTPTFHPGIEGWVRAEFPDPAPSPRPFNLGPHEYVGPVTMFEFGKLWWSTGVYVRLDDFGRVMNPGDAFGSVWVRTVVGLGF
jgi:hypothetical protein